MSKLRLLLSEPRNASPFKRRMPLGQHLVEAGAVSSQDLLHALDLQRRVDAPLGEILVAEGLVDREDIMLALSHQHQAQIVDLTFDPPEPTLAARVPADLCLSYRAVPWMDVGGMLLIATSRPELFPALRASLGRTGDLALPVIADQQQIQDQITRLYGGTLARRAATRVPERISCRTWDIESKSRSYWALLVLMLFVSALAIEPLWTITIAIIWAVLTLAMTTVLKAAALWTHWRHDTPEISPTFAPIHSLPYLRPRVSVLVPLLNEKQIAGALLSRLARLTYPKSQLEVVLVLEAGDKVTRDTIEQTELPTWITVVEVPEANKLTTKPRALNYALDFCHGSIIGVWDAEDAPEPDQIERVVTRFQHAPANVACLQGVLDYYNTGANWMSRCFTIEYAAWWRVLLPGVARLGLVIPLGGTTLFFRREILEDLCGWDAHNVTEDADLGLRLAREGYITELLPTVTYEEANCRLWPWVKQRSRWLKGFLITWCVHMRNPGRLKADLGWVRFWGVQTMFLATFSQFAFAPLLWSFWLALAGLPHPIALTLGAPVMWAMVVLFILSETLNLGLSLVAVRGKAHRNLMWWVFTLPFYFPLGTLAAFKGLYEFVVSPFFWDKTEHGVTPETDDAAILPAPAAPPLASTV